MEKVNNFKKWIKEHKKISILISLVLLFLIITLITILVIQFTKKDDDESIIDDIVEEDILEETDEEIEDNIQEIVLLIDLDGLEDEVSILIDDEGNVSIVNKSYSAYESLIEGKIVIDGVKVENGIQVSTDNEILINISKLSEEEQKETISIILENSENEEEQVEETQEDTSGNSSNTSSGSSTSSGSTSSGSTSSSSSSSGSTSSSSSSSSSSSGSTSSGTTGGTPFTVAYTVERTDIENQIVTAVNNRLAELVQERITNYPEAVDSMLSTWQSYKCSIVSRATAVAYRSSGGTWSNVTTAISGVNALTNYSVYAEDIYMYGSDGVTVSLWDTQYWLF